MPRFNFNTLALGNAADIEKVQENFEEIESKAAMLTDLSSYQTNANKTTTINNQSTNTTYPGTKAVYDTLGVIRLGVSLTLTDGTPLDLQNSKFYYITGLNFNGVDDTSFIFSLIFFWTSDNTQYIDLISKYNGMLDNPCAISKRYIYRNGLWTLSNNRTIEYSDTDLVAGTSPLSTGSLYFVYE